MFEQNICSENSFLSYPQVPAVTSKQHTMRCKVRKHHYIKCIMKLCHHAIMSSCGEDRTVPRHDVTWRKPGKSRCMTPRHGSTQHSYYDQYHEMCSLLTGLAGLGQLVKTSRLWIKCNTKLSDNSEKCEDERC